MNTKVNSNNESNESNEISNGFYNNAKGTIINKIDNVNKIDTEGTPDNATHYKGAVEPLEVMSKLLTKAEFIGFLKGNIIKYSYRAGRKQGESGEKDRNKFLIYSEWLRRVTNLEPIVLGDKIIIL